jgi:CheY-like chemotaxis protein
MEENTGMFAIVLKHKNLSETHFFGILLREFLMNRGWAASPILIASFPAEGSTDGVLAAMTEELKRSAGSAEAPIWLYGSDVGKTYSLLIIDSDPYVRELLETRFVLKGYRVNTAQDGQSGWQLYEELLPELVIMDLHLPMVNGFQILQRIQRNKHHGENENGKVLILSGKRVVEDVSRCFELGADDYMTKPFSPLELEARAQKLLAAK